MMMTMTAAAVVAMLAGAPDARLAAAERKPAPPGRAVEVKTPLYDFTYSYPAAAGRIPALKAWLDKDLADNRTSIAAQARDGLAESKKSSFPFNSYDAGTTWQVVTELPGWLSLSGMEEEYTGGAHPNHGPVALLWNKAGGRRMKAIDLFDAAALTAAIQPAFCAALNKERAVRRGQPVEPGSTDMFDACLDPAKEVLILGSTDHQHFTRIGVLIGPYEAGPYAEGDYEITLPVSAAVIAAARPQYRGAFAVGR
jgi:hypothetical protein